MGTIQYNDGAFHDAQSKLTAEVSEMEALAERFSNSAAALLGSMEGPVAAIKNCIDCLTMSILAESAALSGMSAELGQSLEIMTEKDSAAALYFETSEDSVCEGV